MYLILLVAIISPFIFVNMYQMFDHFHKAGNEALAKEKSTFAKFLSKKSLSILIVSIVSVFITISLILTIKDILSTDNGWILKLTFYILFAMVLFLSIFGGKNKIIQNNAHKNIEPYLQNFASSILLAFSFSMIMFLMSYYFMKIDLGMSLEQYLHNEMPKQEENNLIFIIESITVLKSYFVYYSAQVLGEDLVRIIFSFFVFVQTLFVFYYSAVVVKTIQNVKTGKLEYTWLSVIPMLFSIILFLIVPDYKNDINTVVNLPSKEKEAIMSKKEKEIEALKASKQKDLEKLENKYAVEIKKIKESKISGWKLAKCMVSDCTVNDLIE